VLRATARPDHEAIRYLRRKGVGEFVRQLHVADPLQLVATERDGVASVFVKDLAGELRIPAQRMFAILGVPKATAEKKIASGELLAGSGGRAALGVARLLGMAQAMVEESTAAEARDFDAARWLGGWLERPQPALGGRKPAELVDTPTGLAVVTRLLGAVESGAYQ
jgi:putative toxin-antitoxin system antitoxin component (TIGR02293 family)